jgi:hypothetical protein
VLGVSKVYKKSRLSHIKRPHVPKEAAGGFRVKGGISCCYYWNALPLFSLKLPLNPPHNQRHNKIELRIIQRPALLDSMPLLNAFPATCGSCMLRNEHWMPSHRCLFPIILWKFRGNPGIYKLEGVLFDGFETFGGNVISIFLR